MTEYVQVVRDEDNALYRHRRRVAEQFARARGEVPPARDSADDE